MSTKNQSKKGKSDPKEQRRPRQGRQHHNTSVDKQSEKNVVAPKVVVPEKPTYVDPGPEFYKNLKRETDEILKITEEASSKYKKKEIQSNWAKYEIPIDTYEEIDEQENMGADYEKLAETPLSIGGYFQFKHEKSWDINTEPSLYDKFFDIDMDNLNIAIQTIAFHERNCINKSIFSDTDIQNMKNRSTRFKQKYYKDKSYTVPELQAQDKILNSLRENTTKSEDDKLDDNKAIEQKLNLLENIKLHTVENENVVQINETDKHIVNKGTKSHLHTDIIEFKTVQQNDEVSDHDSYEFNISTTNENKLTNTNVDSCISNEEESKGTGINIPAETQGFVKDTDRDDIDIIFENPGNKITDQIITKPVVETVKIEKKHIEVFPNKSPSSVNEPKANPVIESPEDLEKWLDDFLDS